MGCFERCKWREAKTPCKRTPCLTDRNMRFCLKIPSFGETNGVRAVRGGNPKGSDIIAHFLHRIADRSGDKKGTR